MKKLERILTVLGMCIMTVIGAWSGMKAQERQSDAQNAYADGISTAVAVVNQDMGARVGDEMINYAEAMIKTLGSGYTIVSASAAQTGLQEGAYGAMIFFPSDFSANIASINEKSPKQATITMSIHPDLPEEKYIALYGQLTDLQRELNGSIASAYVETVFLELHTAQDEIGTLFANDAADMEAVEQMRLADYTERLNLGNLPMADFSPSSPDYGTFYAQAQSIASDMNEVYMDSYEKAQEDFVVVQETASEKEQALMEQNEAWVADVEAWSQELLDYVQGVSGYKTELDRWRTDSADYLKEANEYLDAAVKIDQYLSEQANVINAKRQVLNEWRDVASGALGNAGAYAGTLYTQSAALRAKINGSEATLEPETYAEMTALLDGLDAQIATMQGMIASAGDALPETVTISGTTPVSEVKKPELLPAPPEYDKTAPSDPVPTQPEKLTEALFGLTELYLEFNPEEYMNGETTEKAMESMSEYAAHLSGAENAMSAANVENQEQMRGIYETYNEYVGELRTQIIDVHDREQENLANNIGELADALNATSEENHEIMDAFASRMPNSRQRASVNQKVVNNTVQPVTYAYEYVRVKNDPQSADIEKWLIVTMIVFAAMTGAVLLLIWTQSRKARAQLENETEQFD